MASNININEDKWKSNRPSVSVLKATHKLKFDNEVETLNKKLKSTQYISGISYQKINPKIAKANELIDEMCYYVGAAIDDIDTYIDDPFFKRFDHKTGVLETFEKINLEDYKVKNNLGIQEHGTNQVYDYPTSTYRTESYSKDLEEIGFNELLNNQELKGENGIPSFTDMMQSQYDSISDELEGMSYDNYVTALLHSPDIQHTVDRGWLNFLSDVVDIFGVVSIIGAFTGSNFITGEIFTSAEKNRAIISAVLSVASLAVMVFSAGLGSIAAVGMKKVASNIGKALLVDMISGLAGLATMSILEYAGAPAWLTMIAGIGASFVAGYAGAKGIKHLEMKKLAKEVGLDNVGQLKDVLNYLDVTPEQLKQMLEKGAKLESLLGIPDLNMKYLMEKTGLSATEVADWLSKNGTDISSITGMNADDIVTNIIGSEDILVDSYRNLSKNKDILGQAHHLNQDAAFKSVIPHSDGMCVKLEGNIRMDIDSPHYKAHEELEKFWSQYRKGGSMHGRMPTLEDYNTALYDSLISAGLSESQAVKAVSVASLQQIEYGLFPDIFIPKIPGRIPLPKK